VNASERQNGAQKQDWHTTEIQDRNFDFAELARIHDLGALEGETLLRLNDLFIRLGLQSKFLFQLYF